MALQIARQGWERAHVEWRAQHGDDLWAVACRVRDDATLRLVHELIEDAVRGGFEARHGGEEEASR